MQRQCTKNGCGKCFHEENLHCGGTDTELGYFKLTFSALVRLFSCLSCIEVVLLNFRLCVTI